MSQILIDTDLLIDVARGIQAAIDRLQTETQTNTLAISTVTQMELIIGCHNTTELQSLEQFLRSFQIVKLSEAISDRAIDLMRTYRLSHGLLIPDALIAATAIVATMPLLSKNQRDYRFIQELTLLAYP